MPDSGLIARRIGILRIALFASPSYLQRHGFPERPADLADHCVVPNQNIPEPNVWTLSNGKRSESVGVTGPIRCNNFGFMRQLAVGGHGIATFHEPMVEADERAGRLKRVLPDWWMLETPDIALTSTRLLPAKTRLFLDMIDQRVAPGLKPAGVSNNPIGGALDSTRGHYSSHGRMLPSVSHRREDDNSIQLRRARERSRRASRSGADRPARATAKATAAQRSFGRVDAGVFVLRFPASAIAQAKLQEQGRRNCALPLSNMLKRVDHIPQNEPPKPELSVACGSER